MKAVSERVVTLEDELSASRRKEQQLEEQLEEHERELEALEKKLQDTVEKNERLDVQLESCQSEIQFLRGEQDDDKLRIGEYEAAVNASDERIRELETQMQEEKRQREILDGQEKQSTQRLLDDLNGQLAKAREEVRKLRKNLTQKETESSTWQETLETLESGLRETLGDANGTRTSMLKVLRNRLRFDSNALLTFSQDVVKLTHDLEHTIAAFDTAKEELAEKERVLRSRDQLLESTALETRKLSDLLDKERAARQKDRASFDQMQRSQQSLTRTIQQNDTRAQEVENLRKQDLRKFAHTEQQLREMLGERNNLLLSMWNRLSTLCGAEFMQKHSLVDGHLPSVEVIAKNLRGFTSNADLALRTIETVINGFRTRIREVEKSLWKDFQTLEHAIDVRTKRIDHLEKMVSAQQKQLESQQHHQPFPPTSSQPPPPINPRSASRSSNRSHSSEITKLKNENKLLKAELQFHRNTSPTRSHHSHRSSVESANLQIPQLSPDRGRASSAVPARGSNHRASITTTLLRHHSTSAVDSLQYQQRQQQLQESQQQHNYHQPYPPRPSSSAAEPIPELSKSTEKFPVLTPGQQLGREPLQPREQRWVHKLKELERRLKAEREARLLDRSGARKRLEEGQMENEELRRRLVKEIEMRESLEMEVFSGSGTGPLTGMGRSVRSESLAEELEEEVKDGVKIA
jgi:chromosome segregation ATPase